MTKWAISAARVVRIAQMNSYSLRSRYGAPLDWETFGFDRNRSGGWLRTKQAGLPTAAFVSNRRPSPFPELPSESRPKTFLANC